MSGLPERWAEITLGDAGEWRGGGTPSKANPQFWSNGDIPWVSPKDMKSDLIADAEDHITPEAVARSATQLIPEKSVLLVTRSGILRHTLPVGLTTRQVAINQDLKALTPSGAVDPEFVSHQIRSLGSVILSTCAKSGTTVDSIDFERLKASKLSLPPLPEQRRIVAKIDSLTGKSRRASDHLDHIPRLVEKYRQAVLAAAFQGDLTREWRAERHPTASPATILGKIEATRSTLAAARLRPKAPRDKPIAGSRIAVALGAIPDSWALTTLENVTDPIRVIQYGILKPGPDVQDGIPYVKVMNIRNERINLDTVRKTSPIIHKQYQRSAIREGDILLTIRGTVGRLAFVPADLDGGNITQDSVRIAVLPVVNPRYVFWYLLGPFAQGYFAANQKGVAVRGINVGDVRPMELPLPSTEEQDEVVRRIEVALGWIDRLALDATSARQLIDRLDQAVLAKAFRGELVPQDPEDEPATVLLERIRAERGGAPRSTKRRRTG